MRSLLSLNSGSISGPYQATDQDNSWHARHVEEVLLAQVSHRNGLSAAEAAARLASFGANQLPVPQQPSALIRFARQFHNPLVYVLLVAALVVTVLGHSLDAVVIVAVTLINALIGFVQEGRAEQAIAAIRGILAPNAVVLRDGVRLTLPSSDVVPGDVVRIESGDRVPADLRLIDAHGLAIDESALTGESVPAEKSIAANHLETPLAERTCMAFSGSLVTRGQALGVTVNTGLGTEIGRVSDLVASVEPIETPLLTKLSRFSRTLMISIFVVCVFVFAVGAMRGRDWAETLLAVVGIAVAAVPEGLPAIVTIALAIGVQRMANRHAIVRQLPAVETLGSVTVICTDKTGTLTRNEMTVQRAATRTSTYELSDRQWVGGVALEPAEQPSGVAQDEALVMLARGAALCNDARLVQGSDELRFDGDPTEGALLMFARKLGVDVDAERSRMPRTHIIPFESELRYMVTQHYEPTVGAIAFLKGAPETVVALCAYEADGVTRIDVDWWRVREHSMAKDGMRVLAVAVRPLNSNEQLTVTSVGQFSLVGMVGLIDPPRQEAIASVRECHSAGIRVKMITGDHALTAAAIAARLGIDNARVVAGHELDGLSQERLRELVQSAEVFARTRPEHKLALVEALQARGEIVVMTGDGVNDAPALKRADAGIAMGRKGTEAAKESADIVLTDDNFASIAHAVEEGRAVYDNIRKALLYILPTNGAEAMVLILAIVLGLTIPITPVQILWVNMVTEITLSITIAFHAPESGLMQRPPRAPQAPIIDRLFVWRTIIVTAVLTLGVLALFYWQLDRTQDERAARTLAVNALVMGEMFYLFNMRSLTRSALSWNAWRADHITWAAIAVLVALQMLFTYLPLFQSLFVTAAIDAGAWLAAVGLGVAIFAIVEIEKIIRSTRRAPADAAPHRVAY